MRHAIKCRTKDTQDMRQKSLRFRGDRKEQTVERSQDIDEIRELTGERRLERGDRCEKTGKQAGDRKVSCDYEGADRRKLEIRLKTKRFK
jgi:hypothetical protein